MKKHVSEQSCSSVRAFSSILAHLAHLACAFFSDFIVLILACKYKKACQWAKLVVWLNHFWLFLAHLAHLAQSYFSLIFSAVYTYNCFWFDLTKFQWLKIVKKWPMLTTFFLTATAAITGTLWGKSIYIAIIATLFIDSSYFFKL